jgi:hypothetical protein
MADPNEPKKESVRITVPARPETKPPGSENESRDAVRINLPARPPSNVPSAAPAAPPAAPPKPGAGSLPIAPARPPGPKIETARVSSPGDPASKSAAPVQMKKTQPLVTMPESTAPPSVPLTVTSEPAAAVEPLPLRLCWAVLGVSAVILIIQIWNYFS